MESVLLGASLGLAAGLGPGPLLTLVVAASLERGFAAGARVALAPLISDAPVVLLALLVLKDLPGAFLAGISLVGGLFVMWLGIDTLRKSGRAAAADREEAGGAVWRAAVANLLNPHPWIFWASVGGPLLLAAWRRTPGLGAGFAIAFYLLLVGSKVAIAWVVARGRRRLSDAWQRRLLAASGLLLIVLGALLVLVRPGLSGDA